MKDIKKQLTRQVKRSRPSLAAEIKDMPMKDFRALWFVVQQALKLKKENKLNKYHLHKYDNPMQQDLEDLHDSIWKI